uniref:Dolichyl-diphosphooligosaccharide-protein glycosyltransferase subunit TMEM258 n=1 Tax=Parastrongyloides trichosuri TaxID=131310 RepID=A0A0N4ZA11_PARTI
MERYTSPVNPALYPQLSTILLAIGLLLTANFLIYEVTTNKKDKNFIKETMLATIASAFLGTGSVFLMLWVGIYV